MSSYIKLLNNIDELSDSEKRILIGLTTYLNESELKEFEIFNKKMNISPKDSLYLKNTDIENENIKKIVLMLKRYV